METGRLQGMQLHDAPQNAEHSHRVALRIPGSSDHLAVGGREPLRLVAPFGFSSSTDLGMDLERHVTLLAEAGADAVQELSTIGPYRELRPRLIANVGLAYGTVLTYEFVSRLSKFDRVTETVATQLATEILGEQCAQGISYSTIHASLSRSLLALTERSRRHRAIAVPSRSAAMLMAVMRKHRIDNPLFLAWPELVSILRKYKVVASMGSSLRPAAISDALDYAHREEIAAQGILVSYAHNEGVQVLIEGLSHALPDDIAEYVVLVSKHCDGAPATALGPLLIDVAAGHDDIAAVPGIVFGRLAGLSLVNVVSSKEHLAMPSTADMVQALHASKVAVCVADAIQAGRNSARHRLMSEAREALNWSEQARYALFPELVKAFAPARNGQPCTICASRCPHLVANTWPALVRMTYEATETVQSRPRTLRDFLEEALEPVRRKAEIIWFGSLAHRQQDDELDFSGLSGSDIDLTVLSEDADEIGEVLQRNLWNVSIELARSNYGSHISIVSETPETFLRRLDERPDLWNAIWRDGISLGSSDSILNGIQRENVRRVSGNLAVRYAVRSLELALLQISLASKAKAPRETLDQILKRKVDGAYWPLAHAIGSFSKDKESSRRSVLSFLGCPGLPDMGGEEDQFRIRVQLNRLLQLTDFTLAEVGANGGLVAKPRAHVEELGIFIRAAAENWPNFILPPEMAHSILYGSGPQYAFLKWAFLEGGMTRIFEEQRTDHASR